MSNKFLCHNATFTNLNCIEKLNGLKIAHLNINRLANKVADLKHTLVSSNIDICFITESWLTGANPTFLVEIPNFNLIRVDRTYSNGGGIVLYFKSSLQISIVTSVSNQSLELMHCDLFFSKTANLNII